MQAAMTTTTQTSQYILALTTLYTLAMGVAERPATILLGANPAASRQNLINWIDNIIWANVHGVDVMDRDAEGVIVPGSYSGLRAGEWGQVLQALGARDIRLWSATLDAHNPPLSCGRLKVVDGFHGRGRNTTTFVRIGPFLT